MNIKEKKGLLQEIYDDFESRAQAFKAGAVCRAGCAFCCTHFGRVDVITLEGLILLDWIEGLEQPQKTDIRKKIAGNMKKKAKGAIARCPFLRKDDTCRVYEIRPFSCRQLYSLRACTDQGPTVHRQAVELSKMTVKRLQKLDATGYSGHISYILHLLEKPNFRKRYQAGGFDPAEIASFGKKYGIIINKTQN
jgi:hypothetical protein